MKKFVTISWLTIVIAAGFFFTACNNSQNNINYEKSSAQP